MIEISENDLKKVLLKRIKTASKQELKLLAQELLSIKVNPIHSMSGVKYIGNDVPSLDTTLSPFITKHEIKSGIKVIEELKLKLKGA